MLDINTLLHEIASHNRSAELKELFRRLPTLKLYFSVSPSAMGNLPGGEPVKVPKKSDFRLSKATVKGRTLAVLYASPADKRLGDHHAEIEGAEALRMVLRIPDVDGLLIQAEGTAWVGIEKDKIASLISAT